MLIIMQTNLRRNIFSALYIALAVAAGYALAQFPNIELVSALIFLGGLSQGAARGLLIGGIAELIYSFFNPYGAPAPPVLAAQLAGMMTAGAAGGLLAGFARHWSFRWRAALFGFAGLLLTLWFDLLTTVATAALIGFSLKSLLGLLAFGSIFYLVHALSNLLIFTFLVPLAWRETSRLSLAQRPSIPENVVRTSARCD